MRTPLRENHLGRMLRLYRMVDNAGLREQAAEIGISHATLMRIEHGEACDAATMLKLWTWMLKPGRDTEM